MSEWRPIETASKDTETHVLLANIGEIVNWVHVGFWSFGINEDEDNLWWSHQADDDVYPTHWMPLPEPPK